MCYIVAIMKQGGNNGIHPSHHQLDEAVVLADVPLEDVLAGPKHALESSTIKLDALQSGLGSDSSCTRSLQQQSNLT